MAVQCVNQRLRAVFRFPEKVLRKAAQGLSLRALVVCNIRFHIIGVGASLNALSKRGTISVA